MKKIGIFLLVVFVNMLGGLPRAEALGITPFIFEIDASPGQVLERSITLHNDTGRKIEVDVKVQDFVALDDTGRQRFLPHEEVTENSMYQWIGIPETLVLEINESQVLNFTISIPTEAQEGGRYAAISFYQRAESAEEGKVVSSAIASLILLTVTGPNIMEQGRIVSFQVGENDNQETVFETVVKNSGNVHLKPLGHISVEGEEISFNDAMSNVLPGQSRKFSTVWPRQLDEKTVKAEIQAKIGEEVQQLELGYVENSEQAAKAESAQTQKQSGKIQAGADQSTIYYLAGFLVFFILFYLTFRSRAK